MRLVKRLDQLNGLGVVGGKGAGGGEVLAIYQSARLRGFLFKCPNPSLSKQQQTKPNKQTNKQTNKKQKKGKKEKRKKEEQLIR